jgi:DNA-binding transcriptional regulator YhcF (GntR family)
MKNLLYKELTLSIHPFFSLIMPFMLSLLFLIPNWIFTIVFLYFFWISAPQIFSGYTAQLDQAFLSSLPVSKKIHRLLEGPVVHRSGIDAPGIRRDRGGDSRHAVRQRQLRHGCESGLLRRGVDHIRELQHRLFSEVFPHGIPLRPSFDLCCDRFPSDGGVLRVGNGSSSMAGKTDEIGFGFHAAGHTAGWRGYFHRCQSDSSQMVISQLHENQVMLNVQIQYQSNKAIYQQLYDQIASQIIGGQLAADEMLPSIRLTAKEFRVSVITVKKAWEMLERNGLIYTVTGKGSFVKTIDTNIIESVPQGLHRRGIKRHRRRSETARDKAG